MAALDVPTDIQQPGTQPQEISNLESPDKCDNCHGGYDQAVEPAFNWRGSMMAQAARDPLFDACLAVAEQDAPSVGDHELPDAATAAESRDASRALRGQLLRQEVYADDGAPRAISRRTRSSSGLDPMSASLRLRSSRRPAFSSLRALSRRAFSTDRSRRLG